jgi:hydrogenase maturation protease
MCERDAKMKLRRRVLHGVALRGVLPNALLELPGRVTVGGHGASYPLRVRVLVAGVGNILRGDDGFGVVVSERLLAAEIPRGVHVMDAGIGGIHVVQELLEPTDALIVVDAVDFGRPPGTVVVIRPDVVDVASMSLDERRDELADMHYATPERAFMLARGLGVLPAETWLVGCQPGDVDHLGEGLSPQLAASVDTAVAEVRRLVSSVGLPWP